MTDKAPKIDAPGLTWRKLKHGWECRWRCRRDIVDKGYVPKNVRLFMPTPQMPVPDPFAAEWITDRANALQDESLMFGRGGIERQPAIYSNTWESLIDCYRTDPDSPYLSKRYNTRQNYDSLCRLIKKACGTERIADGDARRVLRLYEQWSSEGRTAMGHSMIGMMRSLLSFGATLLKCKDCRELKVTMHDMRFKGPKPREERLTAEMAEAIRALAPSVGRRSLGLAQAFQFDLMLRQKDVIGEWVPVSEPGLSDVLDRNEKWARGLRWDGIDKNFILRHTTSKRQKDIDPDLTLAPMVMSELRFMAGIPQDAPLRRDMLPASGPVVVNEFNGLPWRADVFRRTWRELATACGIPNNVRSMDSRAGAISEATDAGAQLEDVRHAATHSEISQTQRYSRGSADKVAKVMKLRAAHRGKSGADK